MRGLLRDFADRGGTVLLSQPPAARGRGRRRPPADHRQRRDRRRRLAATSCSPAPACSCARPTPRRSQPRSTASTYQRVDGGFVVEAEPEDVGRAALRRPGRPHPPRPVRGRRPRTALLRPHGGPRMNPTVPPPHARRAAQDGRHARRLLAAADRRRRSRCVVVTLFCIFGETDELIFRDMFALAIFPASLLLPIVGILLVTLGVDAADRADHVHARAQADAGDERQARRGRRARADRHRDRARRRRRRDPRRQRRVDAERSPSSARSCCWRSTSLLTGDRVRRGLPELRAGDRPLLRAARRRGRRSASIPFLNDAAEWLDTTRTTDADDRARHQRPRVGCSSAPR